MCSQGWWSGKTTQQRVKECNTELREFYLHNLSNFESYHLVYNDESGCDKWIGFQQTGSSVLGAVPRQVSRFKKYQILPAYAQDSIMLSSVFHSLMDASVFETFLDQLLRHCRRWLGPESLLVMDNILFLCSEQAM